ncbi:hypothetical protein, partial [uncultured Caulobacter sp.]|uniref:hypothetical protein n=1 Tax=uncultured Caulobacter sp. TaxID=158749 RepID=UPI0026322C81
MAASNGAGPGRTGKATELDACRLLAELTGYPAERAIGEGRKGDRGDLHGLPRTCVQVSRCGAAPAEAWARARAKAAACQTQQGRARADYGVTLLRVRTGPWRAVLTAAQWDDIAVAAVRLGLIEEEDPSTAIPAASSCRPRGKSPRLKKASSSSHRAILLRRL